MIKIELLHQLMLHLPLNLIWRLIGYHKILNKLLLLESFWREKCEHEFELLHDEAIIDSYRIYYLIRSNNLVGKIWQGQGRLVAERVRWMRLVLDSRYYLIFLSDGVLYQYYLNSGKQAPIITDVNKITELAERRYRIESIEDNKYKFIYFSGGGLPVISDERYGPPYDQSLMATYYLNDNHNNVFEFILLSDGSLYLVIDQSKTLFKQDILQMINNNYENRLFILHTDGTLSQVYFNAHNKLTCDKLTIERCLKISYLVDTIQCYLIDGSVCYLPDGSADGEYVSSKRVTTIKLDLPIRTIFNQSIIVTIDGVGTVKSDPVLFTPRSQIKYHGMLGFGFIGCEIIFASTKLF